MEREPRELKWGENSIDNFVESVFTTSVQGDCLLCKVVLKTFAWVILDSNGHDQLIFCLSPQSPHPLAMSISHFPANPLAKTLPITFCMTSKFNITSEIMSAWIVAIVVSYSIFLEFGHQHLHFVFYFWQLDHSQKLTQAD